MNFNIDDRVQWQRLNERGFYEDDYGRGTVTAVDNALEKVWVCWDDGTRGWTYMDEVEHVDVITQLGDLA